MGTWVLLEQWKTLQKGGLKTRQGTLEALIRFSKGPRGSQALPGYKKIVHTLEVERLIRGGNVMSLELTSSRGCAWKNHCRDIKTEGWSWEIRAPLKETTAKLDEASRELPYPVFSPSLSRLYQVPMNHQISVLRCSRHSSHSTDGARSPASLVRWKISSSALIPVSICLIRQGCVVFPQYR